MNTQGLKIIAHILIEHQSLNRVNIYVILKIVDKLDDMKNKMK